jgi:hypothetical protein
MYREKKVRQLRSQATATPHAFLCECSLTPAWNAGRIKPGSEQFYAVG